MVSHVTSHDAKLKKLTYDNNLPGIRPGVSYQYLITVLDCYNVRSLAHVRSKRCALLSKGAEHKLTPPPPSPPPLQFFLCDERVVLNA